MLTLSTPTIQLHRGPSPSRLSLTTPKPKASISTSKNKVSLGFSQPTSSSKLQFKPTSIKSKSKLALAETSPNTHLSPFNNSITLNSKKNNSITPFLLSVSPIKANHITALYPNSTYPASSCSLPPPGFNTSQIAFSLPPPISTMPSSPNSTKGVSNSKLPTINYYLKHDPSNLSRKSKKKGKSKRCKKIDKNIALDEEPPLSIEEFELSDDDIRKRNFYNFREAFDTLQVGKLLRLVPTVDDQCILENLVEIEL